MSINTGENHHTKTRHTTSICWYCVKITIRWKGATTIKLRRLILPTTILIIVAVITFMTSFDDSPETEPTKLVNHEDTELPKSPSEAPRLDDQLPGDQSQDQTTLNHLEDELHDIVEDSEGQYGIHVQILNANMSRTIQIRAGEPFFAASLYKIPLVLQLYEKALSESIDLDTEIVYKEEYFATGAGILKEEEPGSSYDLRYLSALSIIHSDNIAANMLRKELGLAALQNYQEDLGAEEVCVYENLASPHDIGLFLDHLLKLTEEHPDLFTEIIDWMKEAYPRDRIPAGIPNEVSVASKTGTWPGTETYNDAALIFCNDGTVISLVVMSEDVPIYSEGMTTIADIASTVYDHLYDIFCDE